MALDVRKRIWDWRNTVDFALRQAFPWTLRGPVRTARPVDTQLAAEVGQFLAGFPWPRAGADASLRVADIGCRNFFMAPALHALFSQRGWAPRIHGIEIDAYRRLANLRTRNEEGQFFAGSIPAGAYHAMDFLQWRMPLDVAILLHPFVLERSVLAWGLPLRVLQPHKIVQHATALLQPGGLLFISAPSPAELALSETIARAAGLRLLANGSWKPSSGSTQSVARFGSLFKKA